MSIDMYYSKNFLKFFKQKIRKHSRRYLMLKKFPYFSGSSLSRWKTKYWKILLLSVELFIWNSESLFERVIPVHYFRNCSFRRALQLSDRPHLLTILYTFWQSVRQCASSLIGMLFSLSMSLPLSLLIMSTFLAPLPLLSYFHCSQQLKLSFICASSPHSDEERYITHPNFQQRSETTNALFINKISSFFTKNICKKYILRMFERKMVLDISTSKSEFALNQVCFNSSSGKHLFLNLNLV